MNCSPIKYFIRELSSSPDSSLTHIWRSFEIEERLLAPFSSNHSRQTIYITHYLIMPPSRFLSLFTILIIGICGTQAAFKPPVNGSIETGVATECKSCPYSLCTNKQWGQLTLDTFIVTLECWTNGDSIGDDTYVSSFHCSHWLKWSVELTLIVGFQAVVEDSRWMLCGWRWLDCFQWKLWVFSSQTQLLKSYKADSMFRPRHSQLLRSRLRGRKHHIRHQRRKIRQRMQIMLRQSRLCRDS